MDAFEHIASQVFQDEGYWTTIGYKIDLTKEEKRELNNPSMPRPEIDIIAYKPISKAKVGGFIPRNGSLNASGISQQRATRTTS